jgi:hypothetical protein
MDKRFVIAARLCGDYGEAERAAASLLAFAWAALHPATFRALGGAFFGAFGTCLGAGRQAAPAFLPAAAVLGGAGTTFLFAFRTALAGTFLATGAGFAAGALIRGGSRFFRAIALGLAPLVFVARALATAGAILVTTTLGRLLGLGFLDRGGLRRDGAIART